MLFKNVSTFNNVIFIGLFGFMFIPVRYKTLSALLAVAFGATISFAQVMSTQEYIDAYKYAAMQEMKVYNIPASITLGQGILESSSGNSKLARDCNNHFGIKCRKEWTGAYCLADDDAPNECFRGYSSAMESYRDHSMFLKNSSRYGNLFALQVSDYEGWANGLREAGYATNPAYANILIGLIKRYRLTIYDSMVLLGDDFVSPDTAAQRVISINGLPAVYAASGETPESIARRQQMGAWQIYKYNDLKRGESLDPGEIVYLKPKKRKGTVELVTVKEGESMRDISQQYGIKLKQLYKKNHLKPGQQVKPGEVLTLQRKSAVAPETIDPAAVHKPIPPPVDNPKPDNSNVGQPENASKGFHEVKAGETLYSIAVKYGVTVDDLMLWNNLAGTELKAGQTLILKTGMKLAPADTTRATTTKEVSQSVKYHVVISGETLFSISRLYNQPVDSIKAWNGLNGSGIHPGQELVVNNGKKKTEKVTTPNSYTVQPGDTLYSIARKYGLSAETLRKKNNLASDKIVPGQVLQL